jgi:hypothetical protein
MRNIFLLLLFNILCLNIAVRAGDTLVNKGAMWKYLDNGTNQDSTWHQPLFNDSAWSTGLAEFGYGDSDETTIINYGSDPNNKYITTYFRKTFNVIDTSVYKGLRLYLKRDDGVVIYLNGREVYKSNITADTVDYLTEADFSVDNESELYFILIRLDPGWLVNDTNEIAVEVHQSSGVSVDLSFDMMLIADAEAELIRGPEQQISDIDFYKGLISQ